ncbi:hypothetical protein MTR_4g133627 [Medicago truncatula]|uniref:Uncharacterized protein n=1 Tax=Medicago truncatula TaxID=3880 RepID=A0A072V3D8_MEDTR|nr:hypothetical protein MTR_4g133627 [Medicago truncatula]
MCVSWPSKEVKAAMQLYKEMEYETSTNGGEKTVNVDKHQYATFTWSYTNTQLVCPLSSWRFGLKSPVTKYTN